MKILKMLFISCFFLVGCKQKTISVEEKDKENTLANTSKSKTKILSRDSFKLLFNDGDTLDIVSNFYTKEKIDSVLTIPKKLNGKYFYCGKSALNKKIFENNDNDGFKRVNQINTSHNIFIGKDTIYFSGFNNVPCLKENDSILIKSIVYTFYQKGLKTNLLIIDDLIKK